jgi:Spy/CpxP family protein refolding chaperone
MSLSMMYGMLLNAPTVQKDLDLVDDQKTKLKEINEKTRAAMGEIFAGMRDLTPEERDAKQADIRKKMEAIGEKNTKEVEGVLLPDQLKRLKGIALQRMAAMNMSAAALADKGIQKDLKLTDDQVAKIQSITDAAMKKMGELFTSGADPSEMRQKGEQMRKDNEKKLLDVLTADQKTAFDKMKGKKLDIPASELGFGGGRGGRGPGGGGPGGGPGGPGGGNPPPVD